MISQGFQILRRQPCHPPFLTHCLLCVICLLFSVTSLHATEAEGTWRNVVRQTAYWESKGVANNLATIRRWVLLSESYCAAPDRHLLLDKHWRFIGYMDNADTSSATNVRLNEYRQRLVEEKRIDTWYAGADNAFGYPFALACHQPFTDIDEAIARLTGAQAEYRLWGTWGSITAGSRKQPVSLVEMFHIVVDHYQSRNHFTFPDSVIPTFLGKVIIESGGQRNALSNRAARGIMQLRPEVLSDCEIPQRHSLHRIAQVDCALRLMEQNHRNLEQPFLAVFGHLPQAKRDALYNMLLTQAYLIGVGRSIQLLQDEELGKAARYFAKHQANFSAEDIQLGMIYHNLGRKNIGLRSLYYVTDARLAQEALCNDISMAGDSWCQ